MIARIAALGTAVTMLGATPLAAQGVHWSYEGEEGPSHWGELGGDNAVCAAGQQQSPIDLVSDAAIATDAPGLTVHWTPFTPSVANNGHTIQVNAAGGGHVELGAVRYDLLQFHFHHLSEHTIDGAHAPMEVHFVHRSEAGDLLVLGVMLQPGDENMAISAVWDLIPDAGAEAAGQVAIDPSGLLPDDHHAFRYAGSLTTPPCSEIVTWNVYAAPAELSQAQIDAFAARYPHNARPLQAANRRFVLSAAE